MSEYIPVSVIGSSQCGPEIARLAEEVGRELAKRGATVVCGGLGGVMEAVCKGARKAGGRTVGILPREDPAEANPWVEIPILTGIGYARNAIVVKTGMAVIAIDGGFGTLSEIGHALGQEDPLTVIGLKTWDLSKNGQVDGAVIRAKDPVDAVEKAMAAARERKQRRSRV
ncbi:MAG: TIGR00725 family protein [Dehalococcoidia bacterium]